MDSLLHNCSIKNCHFIFTCSINAAYAQLPSKIIERIEKNRESARKIVEYLSEIKTELLVKGSIFYSEITIKICTKLE